MLEITAQIIGIFAFIFNALSYQAKKNKHLYLMQAISGSLFTINFWLLNDYTASLLNVVGVFRGIALVAGKKWNSLPVYLAIQAAFLASGIFTFDGWLSAAITLAQLICTTTLWSRNGKIIRAVQFGVLSPIWLTNNICSGSIGGIVAEITALLSILISFLRFGWNGMDVEHKKKSAIIK